MDPTTLPSASVAQRLRPTRTVLVSRIPLLARTRRIDTDRAPHAGWRRLPGLTLRDQLSSPTGAALVLSSGGVGCGLVSVAGVVPPLVLHRLEWAPAIVTAVVVLAVYALALTAWALVSRAPSLDDAGDWMRRGRRLAPAAAIEGLVVVRVRRSAGDLVALRLSGRGAPRMTVLLYRDGSPVLDRAARAALVRFVRSSNAVLPRDRYDPEGRMSRAANPGWLTIDDAAELLGGISALDRLLPLHRPVRQGT